MSFPAEISAFDLTKTACPKLTEIATFKYAAVGRRQANMGSCRQTSITVIIALLESSGDVWESHCQSHLSTMTSKMCGTITYCHTLVRPGYCPDYLGDERLKASERMQSWTRDHKLWIHVNDHLDEYDWPYPYPYPLCVREALL